jgi:hypothetical protein
MRAEEKSRIATVMCIAMLKKAYLWMMSLFWQVEKNFTSAKLRDLRLSPTDLGTGSVKMDKKVEKNTTLISIPVAST